MSDHTEAEFAPEPTSADEKAKPISRNEEKRQKRRKQAVPHWQTLNTRTGATGAKSRR